MNENPYRSQSCLGAFHSMHKVLWPCKASDGYGWHSTESWPWTNRSQALRLVKCMWWAVHDRSSRICIPVWEQWICSVDDSFHCGWISDPKFFHTSFDYIVGVRHRERVLKTYNINARFSDQNPAEANNLRYNQSLRLLMIPDMDEILKLFTYWSSVYFTETWR